LSLATRTINAAIAGLFLCLLAVFPASARAEVQTIDFDTAPPALGSPLETSGSITFPLGQGLRPYRTDVGLRAHSGTTVGDIGRCADETEATGGDAGSCEFFQASATALLSRTANSVTLFAGRFGPVGPFDPPENATLTAFDAEGNQVATTGLVPIDAGAFSTRLSVSSDNGDIAGFRVRATAGPNGESVVAGDLGIDDLAVNFADGGTADFSLATTNQILALVQGQSVEVPVQVNRLNGSSGPIELTVSGLPEGISAAPLTVPGTRTAATIVLTADPTAPDTGFQPTTATIAADPLGDADVGPGPRTAPLSVRVARDFGLSAGEFSDTHLPFGRAIRIEAPDCAPVDVPLKVTRDIAFTREITLSMRGPGTAIGLRPGLSGEILPTPLVPPGGALATERTLRVALDPNVSSFAAFTIEGKVDGGSSRVLPMEVSRDEDPVATIATGRPGSSYGSTPSLGRKGTAVRIHGDGFCPGTTVRVGNRLASAETTLVDPHTIEFNVPRYATTGPVTIIPRGGDRLSYDTSDSLTVDSFRNTQGLPFENFPFDSLSLDELVEAFGKDEVFLHVNPCWPFGDCTVSGGIVDPIAAIKWKLLHDFFKRKKTSGHCFGISLAVQQRGRKKHAFPPFEKMSPNGPGAFESMLDVEQIKQASDELIRAWSGRELELDKQLSLISREFAQNRKPIVSVMVKDPDPDGRVDELVPRAHAMLVYDLEQTDEAADIYVYDSNNPFSAKEDQDPEGHRDVVDAGVIHIDRIAKTWSFVFEHDEESTEEWTGGNKGSLWAIPYDTVPSDPSLPGVVSTIALSEFLFESTDGAVRVTKKAPDAVMMPVTDGASGSDAGTWVSRNPEQPLGVNFIGLEPGHYSQAYSVAGFVASVADVPTAKGVRDTITGVDGSLTFESGRARPLEIDVAQRSSDALTTAATVETRASADGAESAGFSQDGALTYAHDGAPTKVDFTLTTVRRDGGPATFVSGPLAVGSGDRLWARPVDRELNRVALTVRDARGRKTTRVIRNQGHPRGRLKLSAAKVSKHRLSMRVRLAGIRGHAVLGASLRLMRNGHVVARRAVALKGDKGTRRISWRLPRSLRGGRYRLLADARAVTSVARGSTTAASIHAGRAGWIWVGR
jgi:hypothetical protein